MKPILSRAIGAAIIIAAVTGMLFSLFGILQVWRAKPAVTRGLAYELDLVHATVATTSLGLSTVSDTLKTASGNVDALQSATLGLAQSIHSAQPMMDTLVKLLGQDLPSTITATQTSLNSAASSALLIDNVMGSITSLPLLGLDKYAPPVPLHTALGDISKSLKNVNPALNDIQANLVASKGNLASIEIDVTRMGNDIELISGNMEDARQVIIQYQDENDQLLAQVDRARNALPGWLTGLAWFLTIALVWLFITQVGLLVKGWEMLKTGNEKS